MRDRLDVTPLLGAIRAPSLVIGAELDRACPLEHARMIADGVSAGRLAILADAGHLVNLEQPNEFNHCLLDFLRTTCPTPLNDGSVGCQC